MKRVPIVLPELNHRSKPYKLTIPKDVLETIPEDFQLLLRVLLAESEVFKHKQVNGVPLTEIEHERMDSAIAVLASYNSIRRRFYEKKGGFIPDSYAFSGDAKKHCLAIVDFCNRYKIIDYSLYFATLFESNNWEWCRPINACYSTNCYDIWISRADSVRAQMVMESDIKEQVENDKVASLNGTKKSVYRDLFDHIEHRKAVYFNNKESDLCLANMNETLGFHPKSEICKKCKLADACRVELKKRVASMSKGLIDIISIRNEEEKLEHISRIVNRYHLPVDLYAERI
jgi:hypothetical protein